MARYSIFVEQIGPPDYIEMAEPVQALEGRAIFRLDFQAETVDVGAYGADGRKAEGLFAHVLAPDIFLQHVQYSQKWVSSLMLLAQIKLEISRIQRRLDVFCAALPARQKASRST